MVAKDSNFRISTSGDLEVILLYESHDLLARVISPDYYEVIGKSSTQVMFHNPTCFWDFWVHVEEFIAKSRNISVEGVPKELSLLSALSWFCDVCPDEARQSGLDEAICTLTRWLDEEPFFDFYCSALDRQIGFPLSRRKMINFASNLGKHSLFRLSNLMKILRSLCEEAGVSLDGLDILAIREPLIGELQSRLNYLASVAVEKIGAVFFSLNAVMVNRYEENGTNDIRKMRIPEGVTSPAMYDLYGSALVFKSYDPERIRQYVPDVPEIMKVRY